MASDSVVAVVNFNKHERVYTAGDKVEGTLYVDTPSMFDVGRLSLSLSGETVVTWYDEFDGKHFSHETNLCFTKDFTQAFRNARRPGEQITKVPFEFDLPRNLPSSIESKFGSTRYMCIVEMEYGHHSVKYNPRDTFPFIVLGRFSAYDYQAISSRFLEDKINIGGCFFDPPGEILVRLSVSKDHYLLGHTIDAVLYVENNTIKHTIHEIGLALIQDIFANRGTKSKIDKRNIDSKTISVQKFGAIGPTKSEAITAVLEIPQHLAPTQESGLISIRYRLLIIGDESHIASTTSLPVTIIEN